MPAGPGTFRQTRGASGIYGPEQVGRSGAALEPRISCLAQQADQVLVVANPTAGAGPRAEAVQALVDCLAGLGLTPRMVTDLGALCPLVESLQAAGKLRAIVAAGGDGTVAEIVNRTTADVPVSVFPLGTANLLASYFRLTSDPLAMARVIAEGRTMRFDAGRANGRVFLLMAGCGFDAHVVERMHRQRSGGHMRLRQWSYARPIVEAIWSYRYPRLTVRCEGTGGGEATETIFARWAFVVNLPYYAGGLRLAPGAVGDDGLLDVSTFESGSLWNGLRYVACVALGLHDWLHDYRKLRAARVRIEKCRVLNHQENGLVLPPQVDAYSNPFDTL